MEIKFEWLPRYSDTETPDMHGRWARICYVNGIAIGVIKKLKNVGIAKEYFTSKDFFPSNGDMSPNHVGACKDFDDLKSKMEERFLGFIDKMGCK